MSTRRTLAADLARTVPLRMLGNSLRRVYTVHDDGSFDTLLKKLDEQESQAGRA